MPRRDEPPRQPARVLRPVVGRSTRPPLSSHPRPFIHERQSVAGTFRAASPTHPRPVEIDTKARDKERLRSMPISSSILEITRVYARREREGNIVACAHTRPNGSGAKERTGEGLFSRFALVSKIRKRVGCGKNEAALLLPDSRYQVRRVPRAAYIQRSQIYRRVLHLYIYSIYREHHLIPSLFRSSHFASVPRLLRGVQNIIRAPRIHICNRVQTTVRGIRRCNLAGYFAVPLTGSKRNSV